MPALTSANAVDVYFDVASVAAGDQFRGGIYVDAAADFANGVKNAMYSYYVLGNGGGTHGFNGVNYYTLAEYDPALGIALGTVADTAHFAGGTVTGRVMQFAVTTIPEPGTLALLATGYFAMLAFARHQRK